MEKKTKKKKKKTKCLTCNNFINKDKISKLLKIDTYG